MIDAKTPTPPAPYSSTPTQPAIKPIPEGSGPSPASMPSPPSGSGRVQNIPTPADFAPQGNALGSFPKAAAARAAQAGNR